MQVSLKGTVLWVGMQALPPSPQECRALEAKQQEVDKSEYQNSSAAYRHEQQRTI
jgi:hypothetical protein